MYWLCSHNTFSELVTPTPFYYFTGGKSVIDVPTTITSIHDTSRHDTIVNVMFTQLFYLLTITKLRHPDTASILMCYIDC
jgi:hypothetical protein